MSEILDHGIVRPRLLEAWQSDGLKHDGSNAQAVAFCEAALALRAHGD